MQEMRPTGARGRTLPERMGGVEDVQRAVAEGGLAVGAPGRLLRIAVPLGVAHPRRVAVRLGVGQADKTSYVARLTVPETQNKATNPGSTHELQLTLTAGALWALHSS